uniref:Coluporin-12 n=1 Tax=Colubraria reticulata TaxID=604273 RepID=A0A499RI34_9CAEN|nr:coluporin-12 [Colubraria reticulata]
MALFPRLRTLMVISVYIISFPAPRSMRQWVKWSDDPWYRVKVEITVENLTSFPLLRPVLRLVKGVNSSSPADIDPNSEKTFNVRLVKTSLYGTYGTVSWEVSGENRRFVVMWSAPYSFDLYSNWMGLGLTTQGQTDVAAGDTWFDQMYYKKSSELLKHIIKKFKTDENPVNLRVDDFNISGTMTSGHHAKIKIQFQVTK